MSQTDAPAMGHNNPPVNPPSEVDLLADLRRRYPLDPRLKEFEEALATYPSEIKDEETAKNLQDLLGQMKDSRSAWKGQRAEQKKPWDKLTKVVMNFFGSAEEKVEGWEAVWRPRLDAYLDEKRAAAQRAAEEAAAAERARADASRREAEEAEARRVEAERAAAEAVRREEEARAAAAEADRRRQEAEQVAANAAAEARRVEAEKKAREKAEREQNEEAIRAAKRHLKTAESQHEAAEQAGDEADPDAIRALDDLIRPGGTIGTLMAPVATSALLDDDQKAWVEETRARLGTLRQAQGDRLSAKERRTREKARKAQEAEEAEQAAARAAQRAEDEERARIAREARELAETEAEEAKKAAAAARKDVTAARREANEAHGDAKDAARAADRADDDAGRVENRAGRMERRVEGATEADYSRTRGDLGTVGSQGRRWTRYIVDEAKLRAVCGPLGPFLTTDALEGATFHVMRARQSGFTGDAVVLEDLPGVEFRYERDLTIRT